MVKDIKKALNFDVPAGSSSSDRIEKELSKYQTEFLSNIIVFASFRILEVITLTTIYRWSRDRNNFVETEKDKVMYDNDKLRDSLMNIHE